MKIKNTREMQHSAPFVPHIEGNEGTTGFQGSFEKHYNSKSRERYEEYLSELAHEIDDQGKHLLRRTDMAELVRYRELISRLVGTVVSNSFRFTKENVYDMQGRRRVFATIDRINEKLEELAKDVLAQQQDHLAILGRVDEIRGLVLDLMA